jgi:general secretion pathway protein L
MSLLVIQLPPRDRLGARAAAAEAASAPRVPVEWAYVFSADGRGVSQSGRAATALLPRADERVLLLAAADVSWHRVDIPKAPAARLRDALAGTMEEALLDEGPTLHFALAHGAAPGRSGWVAVTEGPRLAAALAALEAAGQGIDRVVSVAEPAAQARGHIHFGLGADDAAQGDAAHPWLTLCRDDGVLHLRLGGGLARARVAPEAQGEVRWTSTPAAAQAAERWLGGPVPLLAESEYALEAARSGSNLRQFDLAARTRGTRALRQMGQRLLSAEWRPVRWGLAALLLVQLVGLNAYAWHQRQLLDERRSAMSELLRSAHPGVRTVLDAPLQMQRETDRLRAAAGRAGAGDLEALLGVAAAAWPDGLGPAQTLRFEPGSLILSAGGWGEPQVQQFRERLRGSGYSAEFAEGRVVVSRAARQGAL